MIDIKPLYKYRVYGLDLESDTKIEELVETDKIDDYSKVTIRRYTACDEIHEQILNNRNTFISKDNIWFHVKGIAVFQIRNGNTINFEQYENAEENLFRVYLMCSCLGFIMLQRKKLAIHGGTIISKNKAFIITGQRGAGKSTLTTAFRKRGYSFVSDDVSPISDGDEKNKLKVNYGFPYQKLCIDSMDNFNYEKDKVKSYMCGTHMKYIVPAKDNFIYNDIPLDSIFEITVGDGQDVVIEEVKGIEKYNNIMESVYRGEYLNSLGDLSQTYVKKCLNVARNTRYYKIIRPKDGFTVDKQIELIEKIIR